MFNDRGNPSPFPSTTSTDSLPESLQFSEMPASTPSSSPLASSSAENKKTQDRWSKEEEKLLVQLWAEITRRSQHGVVFCSQILFWSATVALRTNFLSLADFKSNLSRTNVKLPSSATWPLMKKMFHKEGGNWFSRCKMLYNMIVMLRQQYSTSINNYPTNVMHLYRKMIFR